MVYSPLIQVFGFGKEYCKALRKCEHSGEFFLTLLTQMKCFKLMFHDMAYKCLEMDFECMKLHAFMWKMFGLIVIYLNMNVWLRTRDWRRWGRVPSKTLELVLSDLIQGGVCPWVYEVAACATSFGHHLCSCHLDVLRGLCMLNDDC